MTETELIAQQALEIANLKEQVSRMEDDRRSIRMILAGVGGPLNDNKLGYSNAQLLPFAQIESHASI